MGSTARAGAFSKSSKRSTIWSDVTCNNKEILKTLPDSKTKIFPLCFYFILVSLVFQVHKIDSVSFLKNFAFLFFTKTRISLVRAHKPNKKYIYHGHVAYFNVLLPRHKNEDVSQQPTEVNLQCLLHSCLHVVLLRCLQSTRHNKSSRLCIIYELVVFHKLKASCWGKNMAT